MASLRGKAGRVANAVKRSPQLIRKKFEQKFGSHETLKEDWLHENEALVDGISFYVKYLGCVPSVEAQGQGCTDEAVKRIVVETKKKKSKADNKLQKVVLTITPKHIKIRDLTTKAVEEEIPIFRVSYCTADPNFPKVFAFNAREKKSLMIRCRAVLCTKKKMAKAIALTVAQAFNVAFEAWENSKEVEKLKSTNQPSSPTEDTASSPTGLQPRSNSYSKANGHNFLEIEDTNRSLSFSALPSVQLTPPSPRKIKSKRPLTSDFSIDHECDEEFTKLARARSNPHLLDIGVEREEIQNGDWNPYLDVNKSKDDLYMSKSAEDLTAI